MSFGFICARLKSAKTVKVKLEENTKTIDSVKLHQSYKSQLLTAEVVVLLLPLLFKFICTAKSYSVLGFAVAKPV